LDVGHITAYESGKSEEPMNIRDIAKLAGVSHTTVSKILNNKGSISDKTKKKVLSIIKKNNFYPNEAARRTSLGRGEDIAFVSTRYASAFISLVIEGAENRSFSMGIYANKLSLYSTRGLRELKNETFMKIASGNLADAVIALFVKPSTEAMAVMKKAGIPLILLEAKMPGASSITVDNMSGAFDATSYLVGKGRKKIAVIRGEIGHEEVGPTPSDREKGYIKALTENGMTFDKKLVEEVRAYTYDEGKQALDNLLARDKGIDAVFCAAGDMCALGVMERAKQLGIRIPDDIALIGFDDIPIAANTIPSLTTVKQPIIEMGGKAFEIAVDAAEGRIVKPVNISFKPELILRDSAG